MLLPAAPVSEGILPNAKSKWAGCIARVSPVCAEKKREAYSAPKGATMVTLKTVSRLTTGMTVLSCAADARLRQLGVLPSVPIHYCKGRDSRNLV